MVSTAMEKRNNEAKLILNQADVKSATLMKQASELLDSKSAMQIRYLDLVENIATSKNCKIIMPLMKSN